MLLVIYSDVHFFLRFVANLLIASPFHYLSCKFNNSNLNYKSRTYSKSDILNIESDILNIESDILNVESDILNVESDILNVESDILNADLLQLPIEAHHYNQRTAWVIILYTLFPYTLLYV